jgi:hypothetical protein
MKVTNKDIEEAKVRWSLASLRWMKAEREYERANAAYKSAGIVLRNLIYAEQDKREAENGDKGV